MKFLGSQKLYTGFRLYRGDQGYKPDAIQESTVLCSVLKHHSYKGKSYKVLADPQQKTLKEVHCINTNSIAGKCETSLISKEFYITHILH